jgi:hypothetical protein
LHLGIESKCPAILFKAPRDGLRGELRFWDGQGGSGFRIGKHDQCPTKPELYSAELGSLSPDHRPKVSLSIISHTGKVIGRMSYCNRENAVRTIKKAMDKAWAGNNGFLPNLAGSI